MARRTYILLGILFLLALSLLFVYPGRNVHVRPPGPNLPVNSEADLTHSTRNREPLSESVALPRVRTAPTESTPVEPLKTDRYAVRILFEDLNGRKVGRWKFKYRLFDERNLLELDLDPRRRGFWANRCVVEAFSSEDGTFVLTGEGRTPSALLLSHAEGEMTFVSEGDSGFSLAQNESAYLLRKAERQISVRLSSTIRLAYSICYSDGAVYQDNMAGLTYRANGRTCVLLFDVKPGEDLLAEVPANSSDILVTARSTRMTFRESNEWRFDAPDIPTYQRLVIPSDPEQIVVVVHLAQWQPGETAACFVCRADGGVVVEGTCPAGEDWITTRVPNMGLDHCVEVRGPSGVWRSAFFQPQKGARHEFYAVASSPGSVRVRFVDGEGKPLVNSFIYLSPNSYPSWRGREKYVPDEDVGRSVGFQAECGKTAVAELGGLPPGDITVFLEAFGCEVETRSVRITSNRMTDLGDVVMKPALGRITLNLSKRNPEYGYYVWLAGPNGSGIVALKKDVKSNQVTFEHLAQRKYTIQVAAGNGGRGKNIDVVLAADGTAVIDVDVQDLRPRDNK